MKNNNLDAKIALTIAGICLLCALAIIFYAIAENNRIYGPPLVESNDK